jgi:hypothetical protein
VNPAIPAGLAREVSDCLNDAGIEARVLAATKNAAGFNLGSPPAVGVQRVVVGVNGVQEY